MNKIKININFEPKKFTKLIRKKIYAKLKIHIQSTARIKVKLFFKISILFCLKLKRQLTSFVESAVLCGTH